MLAALPPPPGHQGHAGIFVPDAWASLSTTGIAWRGVGGDLADDVAGEVGGGGLRGRERIGAARDMHVDIGGVGGAGRRPKREGEDRSCTG